MPSSVGNLIAVVSSFAALIQYAEKEGEGEREKSSDRET